MISKLNGKLNEKRDDRVIVEVRDIFYEIFIPAAIMLNIDSAVKEERIELVIFHYHHIEPSRSIPILIGFINEVEKEFFVRFITVSGVGPKAALRALNLPIPKIARAIDEGDFAVIKSLPGIGTQRAKQIIAKLQGKVGKFALIQQEFQAKEVQQERDITQEALEVMRQLQYKESEAKRMLDNALSRNPDIKSAEELLNEVYKNSS